MRRCRGEELLHAAVVAVGVLEAQTHLGSVLLEVEKLFGVESSTSLPAKERGEKGKAGEGDYHHGDPTHRKADTRLVYNPIIANESRLRFSHSHSFEFNCSFSKTFGNFDVMRI